MREKTVVLFCLIFLLECPINNCIIIINTGIVYKSSVTFELCACMHVLYIYMHVCVCRWLWLVDFSRMRGVWVCQGCAH